MGDIQQWFSSLPPMTRTWFGGTIALSLLGRFNMPSPYWLILDYGAVVHGFQIWRLVTCVFFYSVQRGFHFLITLYFLYSYSLRLETGLFARRPADYLFMLLFVWICCLIVGLLGGMYMLMDPMVMAVLYVWCQLNKDTIVSFWFGTQFKAMYLPWILFAFNVIMGNGGMVDLSGILIGHLYFFLTFKYPQDFGGVSLLQTPHILYKYFPNTQGGESGFGRPPPAQRAGGNDGTGGGGGGGSGGGGAGGGDISLSIEETNKIRAKLGLKPLKVENAVAKTEGDEEEGKGEDMEQRSGTSTLDEFVHKPAENLAQKLQVEKLREKIALQREKRRIKEKLKKVKTLGESDSDEESASAWVKKSRIIQKEKAAAEKRSKMLEELDAQFGIGDLVEKEMTEQKTKKYNRNDLSGMLIEHEMKRFEEGRTTILTLKDSNILDNKEDTLVNVNLVDAETVEKNLKRRLKKTDDKEYEAPEVDEFGNIVQNSLLTKYDEEIEGEKKTSFRLGTGGESVALEAEEGPVGIHPSMRKMAKLKQLQSLEVPQTQLASEYFTEKEMVSFRKVKKTKKKKKKKLTADDLEPLEEDSLVHLGSRTARHARIEAMQADMQEDEDGVPLEDAKPVGRKTVTLQDLLEEEEQPALKEEAMEVEDGQESEQDDIELQEALARSRRAKLAQAAQPSSERITEQLKKEKVVEQEEPEEDEMDVDAANLVMTLNTTDEFCRTLGDIPTYGLSGNRAEEDQSMLQLQQPKEKETQEPRGAWEEVGIDDTRVEITDNMTAPILEEEPDASKGVANALKLALKKGYLEKTNISKSANAALQHLRAVHYSIEDKAVDDDRRGNRGERYIGPVTDFKEKDKYKPDVKLEYVDDEGRKLNAKEAFRYLSHKFHGKGSGKNKTEKRMKKWNEELLMKHMSSSDTPLQTLERQREKQKQLGAAYLVLSGSKTQESMDVKK